MLLEVQNVLISSNYSLKNYENWVIRSTYTYVLIPTKAKEKLYFSEMLSFDCCIRDCTPFVPRRLIIIF